MKKSKNYRKTLTIAYKLFMDFLENKIETENFILEPITVSHAKELFDLFQDKELYIFIPIDAPKSVESLKLKFEKWQKRYSEDKNEIWINYAILDKKTKKYKGTLQATIIKNAETYIAYEIFPKYWRNGIAKECVSRLIDILFIEFKSEIITAHLDTRNTASLKLLESLNFKFNRKIIDADFFKNTTSDEFVYELIKYS